MLAYEQSAFEANLTAVADNDPVLRNELYSAFVESAAAHADLLRRARCDGNWTVAAMRLKGLGASFHAIELTILAQNALEAAPGEPTILRKIDAVIEQFRETCRVA